MSTIALCSGKGSPGTTFVAANLASALARDRGDVLLIDLDPAGGDLGCYLRLDPRRGLYPLLRMEGRISGSEQILAEAEEKGGFPAVCGFPEPSDLASTETLGAVLDAIRSSGRTVIADLGRVSEANAAATAEADRIVLVVRPDLVSVLGAQRALRALEVAGAPLGRIAVVICGLERRRPGDVAEVKEALRLPVLGTIPLDRRGVRKALLAQQPVQTRRLARAFDALASAITDGMAPAEAATDAPPSLAERLEVSV